MSDESARPAGGLSTALTVLIGLSAAAAVMVPGTARRRHHHADAPAPLVEAVDDR